MSDNVIPLRSRDARDTERAESERAAEEKKAVSDRIRAMEMRQRIGDKKKIDKESDRIRVAKNLGCILSEMEAKGRTRQRLLRDLGMGSPGDSTKQLYNYVLPEDETPECSRVSKLTKTAAKYLLIAERAAKAMDGDAELIVLRLFENTSYQVPNDTPDEKIASMDQVRELLVSMARAAIRRKDTAAYLDLLQSRKIGWDIDGSIGNYPCHPSILTVFIKDRAARHVGCVGHAPTVFLYGRDVPMTPIQGEAFQIDFEKDGDAAERFCARAYLFRRNIECTLM